MGANDSGRFGTCAIEGCVDPVKVKSRGWCSTHYQRWQKHGDPLYVAPPKEPRLCTVDGCDGKHRAFGYCTLHYKRWKKHGDPLFVTPLEEYSGPNRKKTQEEARSFMLSRELEPLEPFVNVDTKWKCRCMRCGEIVSPTYNRVEQGGLGCWTCGRNQAGLKRRADEDEAVQLMLTKDFLPSVPYQGTAIPWPGVCLRCGQPGKPTRSQAIAGGACAYCAKLRVDPAIIIGKAMAVDWIPLEPFVAAQTPWRCRCMNCGVVDTPTYYPMTQGAGCNSCARKRNGAANAIKLRAAAQRRCAELAEEWGFKVVRFFHRADKRQQEVSWIQFVCPAGHDGERRVSAFMSQQGCWSCATRGFNVSKRGVFYAVRNNEIVKCGIANAHSAARRLDAHRGQGLTEQVGIVLFARGVDAVSLEKMWLEYRDTFLDKADLLVGASELPDGFRESLRRTLSVDRQVGRLLTLGRLFGEDVKYSALRRMPPE